MYVAVRNLQATSQPVLRTIQTDVPTMLNLIHTIVYFGCIFFVINRLNAGDVDDDQLNQNASDTLVTDIVSFDITIGGEDVGTIDIGLFGETVPKTVKNFLALATGDGVPGYSGTKIHRIIDDFMVQGGDVVNNDGTGETSIYGGRFEDENFKLYHYGAGWVSMANAGENTNTCQFFITARPAHWLNDKHVVFGKVMRGMWVLRQILNVETNPEDNDRPLVDVVIAKSSASKPDTPFTTAKIGADWMT